MKENMKELEVMCHVFLLSFLYDLDIKFSHVNSLPTWQGTTHNVDIVGYMKAHSQKKELKIFMNFTL